MDNKNQFKPSNVIVGISFGYHDSSCCIMKDGELVAAVQEERFSRVKNDKSFPQQSLRYCLEVAQVTLDQVDCIAYYECPEKKLSRQIWMGIQKGASAHYKAKVAAQLTQPSPMDIIRQKTGYSGDIEIVEHHLSHAASTFYFSGFDEAAVLTVDGVGEWSTTSYGKGAHSKLELFEEVSFPDSIGLLYSTVTSYLGFKVNSGEYKVMGLAPYGKPRYAKQIRQLIELKDKGQFALNMKYFAFLQQECMYSEELIKLFNTPAREPESAILQFHKDIAKSLQVVLEEILLEKVRYLHEQVPSKNLCMAGGVALNCVANGRIKREGPFENLFVQPASGDAGTSLGAAAVVYQRRTSKRPSSEKLKSVLLGPEYDSTYIKNLLVSSNATFEDFSGNEEGLLNYVATQLADGKVIGWFQGRMEFGPRSLGARSILADPRGEEMRDKINALVKKRESFRPFAPAIMEDKVAPHFDLDTDSPFMLETCQVKSSLYLPAITHVDNSARVQTVNPNYENRFYKLLSHFNRITDCPILLNTSFNVRGEPIVCSPLDAIMCFVRAEIDFLVLEDFVLSQEMVPELWKVGVLNTPISKQSDEKSIGHAVYSFM
ncbi:carbamoyltransferase [Pseudoalteromonas umbrosa]|uniref:carbamoyltransferase family protein n=1 Tax=Pseudoalteromonas umbrosa TaxID=3048489 RepID=UPI0024C2FEB3|nr:carbamoyltransferase [Pseudoalteromonas sp. B95]MDK1288857.1 carbamoyltransferase [Pseudoalteromonas sp. B95]